MKLYVLDDDNNPILAGSVREWAEWFEQARQRQVAADPIGELLVSTIFLGIDVNPMDGTPVFFETVLFDAYGNALVARRTLSRDEALKVHASICDDCRKKLQ